MSRLTRADIKKANKRRKYSDGRGLFLSVSANGRKTWAFCYTIDGKAREMGLGSIDFLDIEDARKTVMELRAQVRAGVDPLGERKVEARAVSRRKLKGKKSKRKAEDHQVPLCGRAIEILKALPREENNPFVFISKTHRKRGKGLTNMAMLKLLQQDMKQPYTVHGFRSSFRDWAAEETAHPDFVAEKALAHVIKNKVEAAYRRGSLFEKRRALMNDWASYSDGRLPLASQEPEPLANAA